MNKVLTITCNPAVDITYQLDNVRLHQVNRVANVVRRAGGKGVNVACVVNQLGGKATVTGFVGGNSGAELVSLADPGVDQAWLETEVNTRATTAIVDAEDVTLFNEPGLPLPEADWQKLIEKVATLATQHQVVVISGSLPQQAKPEYLTGLIQAGRQAGAKVIVDTSGPLLLTAAKAGADLLKPNREELLAATKTDQLVEGVKTLLELGAKAVLVSDGKAGMGYFDDESKIWAVSQKAVTGNATGAGDSAVAAIAYHLANNEQPDWSEALRQAVAVSAATVLAPTAGSYDEAGYQELLQGVKVNAE